MDKALLIGAYKELKACFLLMFCASFYAGALDFNAIYAYVAYKSGHYENALKIYDDIYAHSKTCENAYNLANTHYKLHSFASALKFYKQALELHCAGENTLDFHKPNNTEYARGDTSKGIESQTTNSVAESANLNNQKTSSMSASASEAEPSGIHFRFGDTSKGIESSLTRAKIWHNLGNTLFMLERLDESKVAYANALSFYQTPQSAQNITYVDEMLAKKQSQAKIFKRDFRHLQTPDSHAAKFFVPNLEKLHQMPQQDSKKNTLDAW